jgi:glycosyltransferase involved in cell wall biosynthesis
MQLFLWTVCPNSYISALADALSRQVELTVVYMAALTEERIRLGWREDAVSRYRVRRLLGDPTDLSLFEGGPSSVHIVCGYRGPTIRWLVSNLILRRAKWVHWSERSHPGLRWYLSFFLKRNHAQVIFTHALGVFAIGSVAVDDFASWGVPRSRIVMLPYTFSGEHFFPGKHNTQDQPPGENTNFCYAGSYSRRKGIDILWKSFLAAKTRGKKLTLHFVGGGGDLEGLVKRWPKEPEPGKTFIDHGPGGPEHVANVMRASDVFILPSRYDGWGVALAEAAACGKTLISTDKVGASNHLIWQGRNGFVVRAGRTDDLIAAMEAASARNSGALSQVSIELVRAINSTACANIMIDSINEWLSCMQL